MSNSRKTILITGASSGIGRATALSLAQSGWNIFLIGRDLLKLQSLDDDLKQFGIKSVVCVSDVRDSDQVSKSFEKALGTFGKIDAAFLNAGVGIFGRISEMKVEDYDIQFDTNVKGVFLWMRLLIPHMLAHNSGQIIVTSSNLGLETSPNAGIYSATKYALQGLVGSVRKELTGSGVKIATVNPGAVNTPWFDGKDVQRERMLQIEDVVAAVRLILEQSSTSDIEMVHLIPHKR